MRLLVCGSREWKDGALIGVCLNYIGQWYAADDEFWVFDGMTRGADSLAHEWVRANRPGWLWKRYAADWDNTGPAAGAIRNQWMLDDSKPDIAVAFLRTDLPCRGTRDMMRRLERAGVPTIVVPGVTP